MNWKVLLTLLGAILYWWVCDYWYTCTKKHACYGCGPDQAEVTTPPPAQGSYAPLTFNLNSEAALTTDEWSSAKDSILAGRTDDNILEIVGYYYDGEVAPAGFADMGMARAAKARELFANDIPAERIRLRSQQVDRPTDGSDRFRSADFNWIVVETTKAEVVELENSAIILFPFNSAIKDQNPKVDDYLNRLVERLKTNGGKVRLTGHTDNKGTEARNQQLGMRRAKAVRDLLVGKGVNRNQIVTESKGESEPVASNDTDQGRHQNRRVVVEIIE